MTKLQILQESFGKANKRVRNMGREFDEQIDMIVKLQRVKMTPENVDNDVALRALKMYEDTLVEYEKAIENLKTSIKEIVDYGKEDVI